MKAKIRRVWRHGWQDYQWIAMVYRDGVPVAHGNSPTWSGLIAALWQWCATNGGVE